MTIGSFSLPSRIDIGQLKTFRPYEIILDGKSRIFFTGDVFHLDIYFRAVKSGFIFGFKKIGSPLFQYVA